MNLKTELKKRIINDMILKAKGSGEAIVLVVDLHTTRILSSACRMYDVMEAGVVVMENLMLSRERLEGMPAIYFLHPTQESITALLRDYADKKKPQYNEAHLFFTSRVMPDYMKQIGDCSNLVKRVKSFVEMNLDWIALESRVFTFDRPVQLSNLYFPPNTDTLSNELTVTSKQIVSLLLTLKEFPYIRYATVGKRICLGLAQFLEADLKKQIDKLQDWKPNENRERGVLLIVDRSLDPVAPLMHEYTYQAMVNDLLRVKGEICRINENSGKNLNASGLPKTASEKAADASKDTFVLSEDDPLWLDFRHKHIAEVMQSVISKFKEFRMRNKMAEFQSDTGKASVKDMIKAMKDMPEYKSMMQKYTKHMSLAEECMKKFEEKKLKPLGDLEQDMATGLGEDGKQVAAKQLKSNLVRMCQDPKVGVLEKLRLMMIYIISQGGVQDSTRKELLKNISIDLQDAIKNLDKLGVDLAVMNSSSKPRQSKERLAQFSSRNKEIDLALMRYVPMLQTYVEQLVSGELPEDAFPYVTPPDGSEKAAVASTRKGRSIRNKHRAAGDWKGESSSAANGAAGSGKKEEEEEDTRPLFIVFVLGGMTFSEMRSMYDIASSDTNANLIIGSTNTIVASEFVRELAALTPKKFKRALGGESLDDDNDDPDDTDIASISLEDAEDDKPRSAAARR